MKTLKGESLARFLNMMRSLTERDDYIGNVETLLMEEKERNDLLEKNLLEVENMKASLEETVTSNEIDFVKVNDALELSLSLTTNLRHQHLNLLLLSLLMMHVLLTPLIMHLYLLRTKSCKSNLKR